MLLHIAISIIIAIPALVAALLLGITWLDIVEFEDGVPSVDVKMVRLVQAVEGAETDIVRAEIIFTTDIHVAATLAGDLVEEKYLQKAGAVTYMNEGMLVHYDGLLVIDEPKAAGDSVELVIRHGDSETVVIAKVVGQ